MPKLHIASQRGLGLANVNGKWKEKKLASDSASRIAKLERKKKNIFKKKCRMLMRDASEARKRLRTHAWRGDPSIAYGAGLIAIRSASWDLWRRRATTRASPDHEFIFRQLRARPVTEGAGVCRRKITTGSVFPGFSLSPVDFIFLEWFFIDRIWVIDR